MVRPIQTGTGRVLVERRGAYQQGFDNRASPISRSEHQRSACCAYPRVWSVRMLAMLVSRRVSLSLPLSLSLSRARARSLREKNFKSRTKKTQQKHNGHVRVPGSNVPVPPLAT